MSAPTPGPWEAFGRGVFAGNVQLALASHPRDAEDTADDTSDAKFPTSYDECIANAHLIASAPTMADEIARLTAVNADLLAALKGVLRVADRKTAEFDAARAAIAKAEDAP